MPKISVIVPCFNQAKYIQETIKSVLKQTFTDFELLVIDDGSTDNSTDIIKKYTKQDKRVKLIKQKNSGVITARTNGIQKATSEYIFMLDADDIIAPETFDKMYDAMTRNLGDIITCRVMQFGCASGEMRLSKPNKINMACNNCLVNAALMRKSDFIACGGFDKKFNIALEDYDLWLNLLFNHNKRIYRIPEILFYYRIKPDDESRNLKNRDLHYKLLGVLNSKYPLKKWHRIRNILLFPKRILRIFFKIKHNTVYLFGIPIKRVAK